MQENVTICIARQFGSGGREIGKALSESMGIPFYDKELLKEAADKSGIMQELFEKSDEKPTSALLNTPILMSGEMKVPAYTDYFSYMPSDRMQSVIAQVIRDVADRSSCVIIGRCADYILRGRPGTVSVFVHAELDKRIQRISRLHNLDEDGARALIRKTDRSRANYYGFVTDREWDFVGNYDLVIDSGRLGVKKSAELIQKAVELFTGNL